MSYSIFIDTATERGLIAFYKDGELIHNHDLPIGLNNSTFLLPALHENFAKLGLKPQDLAYVAAGVGPGSYTGVRIGVMVAKAIAFACKLPLIAVSTLSGFTTLALSYAVIIDAKIGGIYGQKCFNDVYTPPEIVTLSDVKSYLNGISTLVTPKATILRQKFADLYPELSWEWIECNPCAMRFGKMAWEKYLQGDVCLGQQIEILYLRETQAETELKSKKRDDRS